MLSLAPGMDMMSPSILERISGWAREVSGRERRWEGSVCGCARRDSGKAGRQCHSGKTRRPWAVVEGMRGKKDQPCRPLQILFLC